MEYNIRKTFKCKEKFRRVVAPQVFLHGILFDLCDSCVHYSCTVVELLDSCVGFCGVVVDLWDSCAVYCG